MDKTAGRSIVVGVFESFGQAEESTRALDDAGFGNDRVELRTSATNRNLVTVDAGSRGEEAITILRRCGAFSVYGGDVEGESGAGGVEPQDTEEFEEGSTGGAGGGAAPGESA